MAGTLTILGCGSSAGVPAIGNYWGVCDPNEPRNIRTRPSIAIQTDTTLVIVDAGPDFRTQINRERLGAPDAIIITHLHSDHTNGLDELRMLQRLTKRRFPLYAFQDTIDDLHRRLEFMFIDSEDGFYPAVCDPVTVKPDQTIALGDLDLTLFGQTHGSLISMGIRIGAVAYSTDVKTLGETAYEALSGVTTWIVDGAGYHNRSNPVHACIEEVAEMNERVGASRVILTHMPPTMDYQTLLHELPKGFEPAYDGQKLPLI